MKTISRCACVVAISLCALPLFAQTTITGKILDADNAPLAFANVLLLHPADSSLARGGLSLDDGTFAIDAPAGEQYFLKVSMLGYGETTGDVFTVPATSPFVVDDIQLNEGVDLEEVQVTARKPLFEQKIDRLVVNVSNSVTAAGGNALEVLERSPGVIVNRQSNAVSLIGKEGVVVMINGKITYQPTSSIVQMLEGMSADNIESIELITTPPAKYDAEGNAGYINIVLKQRTDLGLNGNFSVSAGYGEGEVGSANLNLNYRNNRFNIFGTYSFLYKAQYQEFFNYRKVLYEGNTTISEVLTERDPQQLNHNVRLGADYELSDKTTVGLLFGAYDNKWTMDAVNTGTTRVNNALQEEILLRNNERNQWKHLMGNFNVEHKFTPDAKINFDIDVLTYEDENPNTYNTDYFNGEGQLLLNEDTRSDKFTPIDIMVGQLGYEQKINDKMKFEGGFKAALSNLVNEVEVEVYDSLGWSQVDRFTNRSELDEKILAAYSSLDYKANDKNAFKFGLRYEYTDSQLDALKEGRVVDRQFGSLFPSIFYTRTINKDQSVNLSYSRRISRPTFNDMAPFAIFIDPNTYFFGNASLQPAISNNYKMDYRYKTNMLSISYSHEDSTIARFQERVILDSNEQLWEPINLKNTHTVSASLAVPIYIGNFWEMQNNIIGVWQQSNSFYEGSLIKLEQYSFNINTTQTFNLPKDFSLELSGFYRSGSVFGRSIIDPIRGMSFGLQKKFANGGGNLRFAITDVFNSIVFKGRTELLEEQGFETDGYFDFNNRTFRLSYSRNFGNSKLKASRRRGTGSEEERRRVN